MRFLWNLELLQVEQLKNFGGVNFGIPTHASYAVFIILWDGWPSR